MRPSCRSVSGNWVRELTYAYLTGHGSSTSFAAWPGGNHVQPACPTPIAKQQVRVSNKTVVGKTNFFVCYYFCLTCPATWAWQWSERCRSNFFTIWGLIVVTKREDADDPPFFPNVPDGSPQIAMGEQWLPCMFHKQWMSRKVAGCNSNPRQG